MFLILFLELEVHNLTWDTLVAASLFTHGAPETIQIPPVTESLACRLATMRACTWAESIRYASFQRRENAINGSSQIASGKNAIVWIERETFSFFHYVGDNEVPFILEQRVREKGGTLSISVKQCMLMPGVACSHSKKNNSIYK